MIFSSNISKTSLQTIARWSTSLKLAKQNNQPKCHGSLFFVCTNYEKWHFCIYLSLSQCIRIFGLRSLQSVCVMHLYLSNLYKTIWYGSSIVASLISEVYLLYNAYYACRKLICFETDFIYTRLMGSIKGKKKCFSILWPQKWLLAAGSLSGSVCACLHHFEAVYNTRTQTCVFLYSLQGYPPLLLLYLTFSWDLDYCANIKACPPNVPLCLNERTKK